MFQLPLVLNGQEIYELNKLDSLAFDALENNRTNVVEIAEKFLSEAENNSSAIHEINANTILGIVNKNRGYYITAVDYYKKALEIAIRVNDEGRISACYNNIGSVYQIQENYSKALEYYKKSLTQEEKLDNPLQRSIRLYNIGDIYSEMDSLSLALSHFNNSLLIEKENNNVEGITYSLLGVADIYLRLNKPIDARFALEEAEPFLENSNIDIQILYSLLQADLLLLEEKFDQAINELVQAKEISNKNQYKVHLVDIYEKEIEISKAKQAFDNTVKLEPKMGNWNFVFWLLIPFAILISLTTFFLIRRSKGRSAVLAVIGENGEQLDKVFKLENEAGKVLLEVESKRIICFEANDNYVIAYYLSKDGELVKTLERTSLKKVDEIISGIEPGFQRVHKSYIVNPNFVEKISGRSQAYKLNVSYLESPIPVSRKFDISVFNS